MKIKYILFGVFLGIVAEATVGLVFFYLLPTWGEHHYIMAYKGTSVWLDKDKKIRDIEFRTIENPHLPLFVRYGDSVLKLDASTTVEEVLDFVRDHRLGASVEHWEKSPGGRTSHKCCSIRFSPLSVESDNGRTLSRITIYSCNPRFFESFPLWVRTAGGVFIFPLERGNVEKLLGKKYELYRENGRL